MTYWSDPENSPQRDIWDWIGVCNTQAHSIGLNTDPAASNIDPLTRRLRTRIWWCIYSRDRLIAMGMRRPLQVNEGTSNVLMLKPEDFDFEPYSPSVIALFRCRQLEDIAHQKRLARMFIEKVKLCQCIGRVLFAQYAPSQRQFGATDRTTVTLVPRQASESEFSRCSQKLDSWLSALPKDAQFIPRSRNKFCDGEDVLLLHGAMLRMLYHATTSALHRQWAALSKEQSKSRVNWANTARTKMHDAAAGITRILQGLNQLHLTRFLPQSGLTVVLSAAVAHLSNSMSDNPAVRESSMYNFQRCVQVLHCLKDIYPAANTEFANLEAAIKLRSGNGNSNTSFQIMQYNSSTTPLNTNVRKPNNQDSSTSTGFLRQLHDQPATDTEPPSTSRARAPSTHEQTHHHPRKSSTEAPRDHSQPRPHSTSHSPRRPFPNDFDDHFATASNNENPFNLLAIDFDTFPDTLNSSNNLSLLTPSNDDLADISWTQALFRGEPMDQSGFGPDLHEQQRDDGRDQEQDLFAFALKDEEGGGGPGLRHHSDGDITGDLDWDLGFQTGDDGF